MAAETIAAVLETTTPASGTRQGPTITSPPADIRGHDDLAGAGDAWRAFEQDAGPTLKSAWFRNYHAGLPLQRAALDAMETWAAGDSPGGVVLFGSAGTGKDHLAFSAARQRVRERLCSCLWRSGRRWFGELRDAIAADGVEKNFAAMAAPGLLVLSDPLPVRGPLSDWQCDSLFRLFDERWRRSRPTIVTVNVANETEATERFSPAVWDRMCDGAVLISCDWPSYRQPTARVNC